MQYTEEQIQEAMRLADEELDQKAAPVAAAPQEAPAATEESTGGTGFLGEVANAWDASGAAIGNLALAGKDAVFGEPEEGDKSQFRKDWEAESGRINDTPGGQVWNSVGAGVGKAAIETKDLVAGEPKESEKSGFRKGFEGKADELKN